jgi:hypothetical protein
VRCCPSSPSLATAHGEAETVGHWFSANRRTIRLRYMAVVLAALAMFLVPKSIAVASSPEVKQRSCEDAGGTFSRHHGTKTCTIVSVGRVTSSTLVSRVEGPYEDVGFLVADRYVAERYRFNLMTPVTTTSQKGNRPVTTTMTNETTEPEEVECAVEHWASGMLFGVESAPLGECQARGLTP